MTIYEKLFNIQQKLKAPKGQYNQFGKYNYRSCEDILEAVKPLLSKNKLVLTITDDVIYLEGRHYLRATATLTDIETGENTSTSALAREDETKKGMDLAQITGSVSSYARKYALNGLFCIDDTKDSDNTNKHGKDDTESDKQDKNLSEAQVKRLFAIASSKGYTVGEVKQAVLQRYNKTDLALLTKEEYDTVCKGYETSKGKVIKR